MLECLRTLKLRGRSPARGDQRLAGRIGNHVKMEVVPGLVHTIHRGLLTKRDSTEVPADRLGWQGKDGPVVHMAGVAAGPCPAMTMTVDIGRPSFGIHSEPTGTDKLKLPYLIDFTSFIDIFPL